jgi:hypothetical protein
MVFMGTDVISLRLYPNMMALKLEERAIAMILLLLLYLLV